MLVKVKINKLFKKVKEVMGRVMGRVKGKARVLRREGDLG